LGLARPCTPLLCRPPSRSEGRAVHHGCLGAHAEIPTPRKSHHSLTVSPTIWKRENHRGLSGRTKQVRPACPPPPQGRPSREAGSPPLLPRKYRHLYLDGPCLIRAGPQIRAGQTWEIAQGGRGGRDPPPPGWGASRAAFPLHSSTTGLSTQVTAPCTDWKGLVGGLLRQAAGEPSLPWPWGSFCPGWRAGGGSSSPRAPPRPGSTGYPGQTASWCT